MHRVLAPCGVAVISVPNEALINRLKRIVFGVPLGRRLVAGGYDVSRAMDEEWHLHAFGRARLEEALGNPFGIETLVGIPSRLMPLRLVARLRRSPRPTDRFPFSTAVRAGRRHLDLTAPTRRLNRRQAS
jgi:hypothetical protein